MALNSTIKTTSFKTKEKGDKIVTNDISILTAAIDTLEKALVNVDNCGNCAQSNCCQANCTQKQCSCQKNCDCNCDCQSH